MLIRNAEIEPGARVDVRIERARVAVIGTGLAPTRGEPVIEAHGRGLMVGLHDHHMHLMAYAAALESIPCGPPQAPSASALVREFELRLKQRPSGNTDWLRGIGYHESVAGEIDRAWLDRVVSHLPVRVQHRSGRLWIFNSCGLERLGVRDGDDSDPLERIAGRLTGRLYDGDHWLRQKLHSAPPPLAFASNQLARFGVTGITDAGVNNGRAEFAHFVTERRRGNLLQDVLVMGGSELDAASGCHGIRRGPTKLYLREAELPSVESFCARILQSRAAGRAVAIHCVTMAELVFAATALRQCGVHPGDRIEHASVASPDALTLLAEQGLIVVTQPNFVYERGDAYLAEVDPSEQPWLYRARRFMEAGIALAGGTDAPYGNANPWLAMAAAVDRRTRQGRKLGQAEALTPQQALALFTGDPLLPGGPRRTVKAGAPADLCLLDRNWAQACEDLASVEISATIKGGETIWVR